MQFLQIKKMAAVFVGMGVFGALQGLCPLFWIGAAVRNVSSIIKHPTHLKLRFLSAWWSGPGTT
jgi:hypothetical protein